MVYPEWQRILKQRRRSSIAFQALSVARSFEKERRYAAIPRFKKIVASLAAKRSNSKSEGAATLCGERKPFRVFVSPFVSPGCIKMGTLLMTWDDEASSASY